MHCPMPRILLASVVGLLGFALYVAAAVTLADSAREGALGRPGPLFPRGRPSVDASGPVADALGGPALSGAGATLRRSVPAG